MIAPSGKDRASALACSLIPTLLHHFNRQSRGFMGHFVLILSILRHL